MSSIPQKNTQTNMPIKATVQNLKPFKSKTKCKKIVINKTVNAVFCPNNKNKQFTNAIKIDGYRKKTVVK